MEVDRQDLARIDGALKELSALSGKAMTRLVKGAAVQASRSAAKFTHAYTPAKKRPYKKINIAQDRRGRKLREKRGFPWWAKYQVVAWQAGRPKNSQSEILLYARNESSLAKKRTIPNKGVAKRAWLFSLRRLGSNMGAVKPADATARKYNDTRIHTMGAEVKGVEIINTVNYNVFAARTAVPTAIHRTANWLQARVKKEEDKLARAFERRAGGAG